MQDVDKTMAPKLLISAPGDVREANFGYLATVQRVS